MMLIILLLILVSLYVPIFIDWTPKESPVFSQKKSDEHFDGKQEANGVASSETRGTES